MVQLDLVISIDTAAAHMVGALGIPTLLLLCYSPDWCWMLGRSDSPWYPSLKLLRQQSPRDWNNVIQKAKRELTALSGNASSHDALTE